jgi:hypothetical protein
MCGLCFLWHFLITNKISRQFGMNVWYRLRDLDLPRNLTFCWWLIMCGLCFLGQFLITNKISRQFGMNVWYRLRDLDLPRNLTFWWWPDHAWLCFLGQFLWTSKISRTLLWYRLRDLDGQSSFCTHYFNIFLPCTNVSVVLSVSSLSQFYLLFVWLSQVLYTISKNVGYIYEMFLWFRAVFYICHIMKKECLPITN